MHNKVYPVWPLLHAFRLMELDLTQILHMAEMDNDLADDDMATAPSEQIFRLFESAYQLDGRSDFAIRLALTYTRVPCGVGFHALHGAPSLAEALHLLIKYKSDLTPEVIERIDDGEFFELHYTNEVEAMNSLSLLMSVVWLLEMLKITYSTPPQPVAITITDPVPDLALYEQQLNFKVTIGDSNSIRFHRSALAARPLAAGVFGSMTDCNELVDPKGDDSGEYAQLSDVIKPIIGKNLSSGHVRIKNIAHYLGTSERTLQRRLAEEGVSLQALQEEVRRNLATRMLQQEDLQMREIAWRLGYSDPGSFFRSFKRWYGSTPAQFRAGLKRAS